MKFPHDFEDDGSLFEEVVDKNTNETEEILFLPHSCNEEVELIQAPFDNESRKWTPRRPEGR